MYLKNVLSWDLPVSGEIIRGGAGGADGFLFLFDSKLWEEGRNLSLTAVNA